MGLIYLYFDCNSMGLIKFIRNEIHINSLPNDKNLDWSKFKAFADDKIDDVKIMISLFDSVENTVGKEENAGYQHFLLFPRCFPSLLP